MDNVQALEGRNQIEYTISFDDVTLSKEIFLLVAPACPQVEDMVMNGVNGTICPHALKNIMESRLR